MQLKTIQRALLMLTPVAALAAAAPAMAQAQLTALNDMCMPWPAGPQARPHFSGVTSNTTVTDGSGASYTLTKMHTGLFPQSAQVNPSPLNAYPMNAPGNLGNVNEGGSLYPPGDSFGDNPTNLLPNVYEDIKSCMGNPIINTLPSTPENPYNLQFAGDPQNQIPNKADTVPLTANQLRSPTDDLDVVRRHLNAARRANDINPATVQLGIDILEGNPVADRSYSGFPVLHYNGPLKIKSVDPVTRTVEVNQIWYDQHIESDAMYIDSCSVEKIGGVLDHNTAQCVGGDWDDGEWFVKYNVYVLNRGHEDFASFPMLYDDVREMQAATGQALFIPNVSLDQTFFPMEEGLKYTFFIKQSPARFFNLTYHWGWRLHPPRVQAHENLLRGFTLPDGTNVLRDHFERQVFGTNPRADENAKLAAISMIGDLAPEKRMWSALQKIKAGAYNNQMVGALATEFEESFFDWTNRNKLPRGVIADPNSDVTIAYLNNTIYGHINGNSADPRVDAQIELFKWTKREDKISITLLNGDYYPHQYTAVDFGGMRGWENTFQNTIPVGGAGAWFTFGRIHWWPHTIGVPTIVVDAATRPTSASQIAFGLQNFTRVDRGEGMLPKKGQKAAKSKVLGNDLPDAIAAGQNAQGLGRHDIEWEFTFDPGRRLRLYQFDAFHHDVAVWSMH